MRRSTGNNADRRAPIIATPTTGTDRLGLAATETTDAYQRPQPQPVQTKQAAPTTTEKTVIVQQGGGGEQGPAGTVAIGTTTTGAPGGSASVTNTGTASAAVLNFTVPQGPQGTAAGPGTIRRINANYTALPGDRWVLASPSAGTGTTTGGTPQTPTTGTVTGNIAVTLADPTQPVPRTDGATPTAYADGETIRVFRATTGGTLTVTAVNAQIVRPDNITGTSYTITDTYNGATFWLDKVALKWYVLDRPTVDDI